jgi:hypothetical protein
MDRCVSPLLVFMALTIPQIALKLPEPERRICT